MRRTLATLVSVFFLAGASVALADIKIGIGIPATGPNASMGEQIKRGVDQAVEDINAKGGLLGEKIVTTVGDDRSDPKEGVSVANKFISENVKFVIGHYNSGVSMPASKEYADGGILEITPASTNPRFTDEGSWNVFRICGRDDQQGRVAAQYIVDHFKGKRIAIVHDKSPYGKGLADEEKKAMNALGQQEVFYDGINVGDKDFSALISKLKQVGIDYLYYGGLHSEAGLIIRQMRDQGLKDVVMISGDGIVTDEFGSIAGPAGVGTLVTFGPDVRKRPDAAEVMAAFQKKNIGAEGYVLYSYAAMQVLSQAIEASKSTDPKTVARQIRSGMEFKTVFGPLSFDQKGDMKQLGYVMYEWVQDKNGKLIYQEKQDVKN
jgi:branched-chain amino acid transport system substrate-binding protein